EKNGEGIQHLALRVDNLEAALAEMKAKGVRLIDEKPRYGAGGAKIAFVHPRSTGGVLLELSEREKALPQPIRDPRRRTTVTNKEKIELMRAREQKIELGGGAKALEKVKSTGRLTARERLARLFDTGSFVELDKFVEHRCVN